MRSSWVPLIRYALLFGLVVGVVWLRHPPPWAGRQQPNWAGSAASTLAEAQRAPSIRR